MSSPSSAEFSDFPSSPEDHPKLKTPDYFNPRKFLKKQPPPVVDTGSTGSNPRPSANVTPAQKDEFKENIPPQETPTQMVNNDSSSPDFRGFPSSPEDHLKLKTSDYFNPRKFLKNQPPPVVDTSSTGSNPRPSANGTPAEKDVHNEIILLEETPTQKVNTESSSSDFSDFPSSPEDHPKLKTPDYFNPRKFLKKQPTPVVDTGSTSVNPQTSANVMLPKKDDFKEKTPVKKVNTTEPLQMCTPPREDQPECSSLAIHNTPNSRRIIIKPRQLVSCLRSNSKGQKKTKRNFGLTLFTSMRCRPKVKKMKAKSDSSDSEEK